MFFSQKADRDKYLGSGLAVGYFNFRMDESSLALVMFTLLLEGCTRNHGATPKSWKQLFQSIKEDDIVSKTKFASL